MTIGCKIDEIRIDGNLRTFASDLEHYAALGLDAVEVPVHGLDMIRNGRLDRPRLQEVRTILKGFDFALTVHAPNPLNLMDERNPALHLAVFQASLEFTAALGAKVLVYHGGRFRPEESFGVPLPFPHQPEREQRLLELEKKWLSHLAIEAKDVTIGVENARPYLYHSPYCYAERLAALQTVIEEINRPNLRLTLDTGHLYMASRFHSFDPVEAVRSAAPLIAHAHVHDNFGGAIYYSEKIQTHQIPFGRGDSHMPVGWGDAPLSSILSAFIESYSGLFIMELRNRYFGHIKESKANLDAILKSLLASKAAKMAFIGSAHRAV